MTTAEVANAYEVVWNGGELLPPHESTSWTALTSNLADTESKRQRPAYESRPRQPKTGPLRDALILQVQHLRGTCSEREIARRLGVARGVVRCIAKRLPSVPRPRSYRARATWTQAES